MKRIFSRFALALVFIATLSACGSSVNLKTVPVEDRASTGVSSPSTNTGSKLGDSTVTPLEVGKEAANGLDPNADGPAGIDKIIYFDYDSFLIKPHFQSVVAAHAKYLAAHRNRKIAVEGHTDERGGREYNLALGQKRAEAVRSALSLLGVADDQVEAVSFGKEKPAVIGSDEEAYAQNRRAELFYR